MRPARAFAVVEDIAAADFGYIINCFRISFELQQNEIYFAARGKFMLANLAL